MKSVAGLFAFACAVLPSAGWAQIYKCPDGAGRTVVQQMPCAGGTQMTVRPASGHAVAPLPGAMAAASSAQPMTEAERLNKLSDESARNRRKQDLDERIVPRARAEMYGHRDQCRVDIAKLKEGQYQYRQNLYGKTHAAQVASEMAAVSAQCDTRDRELTANFNTLLGECKQIGGCSGIRP